MPRPAAQPEAEASPSSPPQGSSTSTSSSSSSSSSSVVRLRVAGLLCMENCGRSVERAVAGLPFVETAQVDFPKRVATVTMKASAPPTQEALRRIYEAVEQVGYEVERVLGLDETGSRSNTPTAGLLALTAGLLGVEGVSTPSKKNKHKDGSSSSTQAAPGTEMEISVGGMTCQSCVRTVTRTLEGVGSVEPGSISVDLDSGIVRVRVWGQGGKEGGRDVQALGQLIEAVEGVGFEWQGYYLPLVGHRLFKAGSGEGEEEDKKEDDDDDSSSRGGLLRRRGKKVAETASRAAVEEEEENQDNDEDEDEDEDETAVASTTTTQSLLAELERQLDESRRRKGSVGTAATEVGLELRLLGEGGGGRSGDRASRNRARNALRSTSGVVCACVVEEDARLRLMVARVRVRCADLGGGEGGGEEGEGGGEVGVGALVAAVGKAGFAARVIPSEEAQERMRRLEGRAGCSAVSPSPPRQRRQQQQQRQQQVPSSPSRQPPSSTQPPLLSPSAAPAVLPQGAGHLGDVKAVYDVKGMTCGACVSTLEAALSRALGVVTAKVALLSERAEVLFDSQVTDAETLLGVFEAVGYDASLRTSTREDGVKSLSTAIFEVQLPRDGRGGGRGREGGREEEEEEERDRSSFTAGLYEGLTGTEGVLAVELQRPISPPASGGRGREGEMVRVAVTYESELVGLRDLIKALRAQGYTARYLPHASSSSFSSSSSALGLAAKQEAHLVESWRRLCFSLLLSVPVTFLAMAPPSIPLPSLPPSLPPLRDLLLFFLSTPVQFGPGAVFYREAYKGLRGGSYGMALLVAMGTTAAWSFAVFSLLRSWASGGVLPSNSDFFMTSCMLLSFILLGKYMEHAAKKRTSTALTKLMDIAPKMALLLVVREAAGIGGGGVGREGGRTSNGSSSKSSSGHPGKDATEEVLPAVEEEEMIPAELVQRGDFLKVVRGTQVPADGVVVRGVGFVDEALITGESLPVTKRAGDRVVGGSLNTEGLFVMQVTGIGEDSTLRQIIRLMEDAQLSKAPIQALADRIAGSFALWVLAISLLTFTGWLVALYSGWVPDSWLPPEHRGSGKGAPFVLALTLGVSTMVVACPCAMGLATPTAIMVGTGVGAANGVLIKGGEALEKAYRLSAVVFDKTGTLTRGEPAVDRFVRLGGEDGESGGMEGKRANPTTATNGSDAKPGSASSTSFPSSPSSSLSFNRLVWAVASAERGSEHPLAKCLVRYYTSLSFSASSFSSSSSPSLPPLAEPQDFQAVSGKGLLCRVGPHHVAVGSLAWLDEVHASPPSSAALQAAKDAEALGKIVIWAALDGRAAVRIEILDRPRPEAKAVLRALSQDLKLQVYMVTGDNARTAATVARGLGIPASHVMAETLPSNKVAKIKDLQRRGHVVAMVGDGINDAPALAQADVGLAIGAGVEVAQEAADMVLMKSDLTAVLTAIHLSRVIVRRIYLNLVWALLYNVVGIPLAAGLLLPWLHTAIPPYVAGAAMALSSVSVVASSLALKWYTPPRVRISSNREAGEESEEGEEGEEGEGGEGEENEARRVWSIDMDGKEGEGQDERSRLLERGGGKRGYGGL